MTAPMLPRAFFALVASRVAAMFGAQLSGFALGIWVFQESGSTARFSLLTAMTILPAVLLMPVAGSATDRFGAQRVLPFVALAELATTAAVFWLAWGGWFRPSYAYGSCFLLGTSGAFLAPALTSLTRQVVPDASLGRANGALQLAWALTTLAVPAVAGVMVGKLGLVPVLAVDAACALVALPILLVALRRLAPTDLSQGRDPRPSQLDWRALRDVPVLLPVVGAMLACISTFNAARILLTPIVLSRYSAMELGWVMTVAGAGMLTASLGMTLGYVAQRAARAVLAGGLLLAIACIVTGLHPTFYAILAGAFVVAFGTVIVLGHTGLLVQRHTALHVQGRVSAVQTLLTNLCFLTTTLLAGPLVDRVFEPAFAVRGTWATALGALWGFGPGCGIACLCSLLGGALLVLLLVLTRASALLALDPAKAAEPAKP